MTEAAEVSRLYVPDTAALGGEGGNGGMAATAATQTKMGMGRRRR